MVLRPSSSISINFNFNHDHYSFASQAGAREFGPLWLPGAVGVRRLPVGATPDRPGRPRRPGGLRTMSRPPSRGRGVAWPGPGRPLPGASPSVQAPPAGVAADPSRAELTILKALMANPITAPYRIVTSTRNGRVVLSGPVGTKAVHDAAVQTGIATGYPIQDDLVIDTAEVYRAAALAASPGWGPSHAWDIPPLGAGTVPFVYPPPCSAGSTTPSSASNRRWSRILRGLARWPPSSPPSPLPHVTCRAGRRSIPMGPIPGRRRRDDAGPASPSPGDRPDSPAHRDR